MEALYAAEYLALYRKSLTEKLEAKERKIFRKILSPVKQNEEYRRRHNHQQYTFMENITNIIGKIRITFYGHIARMNSERLTSRIFAYVLNKKTNGACFAEVEIICRRNVNLLRRNLSFKESPS